MAEIVVTCYLVEIYIDSSNLSCPFHRSITEGTVVNEQKHEFKRKAIQLCSIGTASFASNIVPIAQRTMGYVETDVARLGWCWKRVVVIVRGPEFCAQVDEADVGRSRGSSDRLIHWCVRGGLCWHNDDQGIGDTNVSMIIYWMKFQPSRVLSDKRLTSNGIIVYRKSALSMNAVEDIPSNHNLKEL